MGDIDSEEDDGVYAETGDTWAYNDELEPVITQSRNYSKHHKIVAGERPGRSDKAERKYRRGKEHTGKKPTLRSHR